MSGNKTIPTGLPVNDYISGLGNDNRRRECEILLPLFQRASKSNPVMWGPSIIGFGLYSYTYNSGRSGEFFRVGFAPRKSTMTIYIVPGFGSFQAELDKLGPHKLGRSCLYINQLAKIDLEALERLVEKSVCGDERALSARLNSKRSTAVLRNHL